MPVLCANSTLRSAKVVAVATDTYLKPATPFPDPDNLPNLYVPKYGQDITSGVGRPAPGKRSVGNTPEELIPKMRQLLTIFAGGDKSGMSKRLFDLFLKKQSKVVFFEDSALNQAASQHENIKAFCNFALSAPNSTQVSVGKTRIHQALKNANWDVEKIVIPTDLGVPAFDLGNKWLRTGDFDNGLGVMINGIQHAYVIVRNYQYNKSAGKYCITLKYVFYDVFGLDDDDLDEYGANSDTTVVVPVPVGPVPVPVPVRTSTSAAVGITAWWQLQHQHGYAPLVTRIVLEKSFEVPAI